MQLVADVHGAADALSRVAAHGGPILILGDLVNLIDYRTGDGIVADVMGIDVVNEISRLRSERRRAEADAVWEEAAAQHPDDVREVIREGMVREYRDVCAALGDAETYVIHGNVDIPDLLQEHLGVSSEYVDAEVREIEGYRVGFVGGGIPRIGVPGEVSGEEMAAKLASLGDVDILCTHVAPAVPVLASDTIGRGWKGSPEILDYLTAHAPAYHYFGDIHQPRATTWQVGATRCVNVGYFRATGRAVVHG